jgi:hypothetical protein
MKKEFIESLQENLRYLGFGETAMMQEQLAEEMEKGNDEFQLTTEAHFDEWSKVEATLYFRKAKNDQKFFFIKYDASLMYLEHSEYNRQQTFYLSYGSGVTFKEAFNLLQGRAVYKRLTNADEEKYHAWIQLDFAARTPNNNYKVRQFRDQYGYDLEKTLNGYPIKELEVEELKMNLIRSLHKGNLHPVTFVKDRKNEKMCITACPQFKTISIYTVVTILHHLFPTIKKKNTQL